MTVAGDVHHLVERSPQRLSVLDLGTIPYRECWDIQASLCARVAEGIDPDTLLLLEHPHTYTCGRRGGHDHILIKPEDLEKRGIVVLDVDRGGDVTYHGPGQLVAYPILSLLRDSEKVDYHRYLRDLEDVLIDTLADFAITAEQIEGFSGVWVRSPRGDNKIAAIGVKVDGRGVTSHGIALNISTDLQYFGYIVPCGITGKGVTSMARILGAAPDMQDVKSAFVSHFIDTFNFFPA